MPLTRSEHADNAMRTRATLDGIFRRKVKQRDSWTCQRCGSHRDVQCAHFFPRAREATRWLLEAAVTLCDTCHRFMTKKSRTEWPAWLISRIGEARFEELRVLSLKVKAVDYAAVRVALEAA
jgi:hypothetical protein